MQRIRRILDTLTIIRYFITARWCLSFRDKEKLQTWQAKKIAKFLKETAVRAPRYSEYGSADLSTLPHMDKALLMSDFASLNTAGIGLAEALTVAMKAEESRDFVPMLGGVTVGMSSGTSGNRGVFLVSRNERLRWAGIMLARALPSSLLVELLCPWKPPIKIAFFLRANSNLYTTLSSRRIKFEFFDLLEGVEHSLPRLTDCNPDILVAPATVLAGLAKHTINCQLNIGPRHVISVAEVLEDRDAEIVQKAYRCMTHQLYQATEGFLGYTCEDGTLHLNESFLHVERDWVDESKTRFYPVITDFTRETQMVIRYRLNDILRVKPSPCPCGRADTAIDAVEGRSDDVLWLQAKTGERLDPIYPDSVRRAMLIAHRYISEYSISQCGHKIKVNLKEAPGTSTQAAIEKTSEVLGALWAQYNVRQPEIEYGEWSPPQNGQKRRRIQLVSNPEGFICAS